MLFKNATRQTREMEFTPMVAPAPSATEIAAIAEERSKAELYRKMYERIAQGNTLAEAEEHAREMWNEK